MPNAGLCIKCLMMLNDRGNEGMKKTTAKKRIQRKKEKRKRYQEKLRSRMPILLLKFCEDLSYAQDVINGKLYMKESGYFRRLEDDYRGDPQDGKKPIEIGNQEMYLESEEGERIYLNGVPWAEVRNFMLGFEGDDKVPLFCACALTHDILEYRGRGRFKIKSKYLEELQKFGKYVAIITYDEMEKKIRKFLDDHPGFAAKYGGVQYTDIKKEYSFEEDEEGDRYQRFFKKDIHYKYQNEFRLLFVAKNRIIGEDSDHWICNVGKFVYGYVVPAEEIMKSNITFKKGRRRNKKKKS